MANGYDFGNWYVPQFPSMGQWGGYTDGGWQQMDQIPGVFPSAAALYMRGGPQQYPGYTTSWFNPLQEQGFGTQLQAGSEAINAAQANQDIARQYLQRFNQVLGDWTQSSSPEDINAIGGSFDPWNNPALDEAVQRANQALSRDFNQTFMPQSNLDAIAAGQMGSSRHGVAQGIGAQGLADAMSRQTSSMYNQGFESGMNRYVQDRANTLGAWNEANRRIGGAAQMIPGMASMAMGANQAVPGALQALGGIQTGVGGGYQGLMNQYLQQQSDMWNREQMRPYENLNWYSNILNQFQMPTSSTSQTSSQGNPWAGFAGGALMGNWRWNQWAGGGGGGGGNPWLDGALSPTMNPAYNWWQTPF